MGLGARHACAKRYPKIWAMLSRSDGGDQRWGFCDCGRHRSCSSAVKSSELGQVWAIGAPRLPRLARIGKENPTNTPVGFWPRDRGQRWENDEGRAPGGLGVTPARNPSRGERQSSTIGLGLALVGVGECYGPTPGHGTGLSWPDNACGAASKQGRTPVRPNWLRSGANEENRVRERVSHLGTELWVAWRGF
jgi:hypothetical protein